MSSRKYSQYIDTSAQGLIIQVEHKLDTEFPSIFLFEDVNLTDKKVVPLYDSRIVSIETRGTNLIHISFNSLFKGYIEIVDVKNTRGFYDERLERLEEITNQLIQQQKQLTTLSQWKQMNTYQQNQIDKINIEIESLKTEIDNVKSDIESL